MPVLDHDGVVKRGLRKRPIREFRRDELPEHITLIILKCGWCWIRETPARVYGSVLALFVVALAVHFGVRNLAGYNRKVREANAAGEPIPDPVFSKMPGNEDLAACRKLGADVAQKMMEKIG